MKILFYVVCACALLLTACGRGQEEAHRRSSPLPCVQAAISKETAILIAKGDASQAYTLSAYNISTYEQPTTWRVVFDLREPGVDGGGPDYLIDKETGKILNATYYK
jgi:hypothetical protein